MINEICDEVNIKISPEPEAVVEAAPGRGVALTTDTEQGMRDTLVAPRATGAQGTTSTQPRGLYCFHSWLYFWFVPLLAPGNGPDCTTIQQQRQPRKRRHTPRTASSTRIASAPLPRAKRANFPIVHRTSYLVHGRRQPPPPRATRANLAIVHRTSKIVHRRCQAPPPRVPPSSIVNGRHRPGFA